MIALLPQSWRRGVGWGVAGMWAGVAAGVWAEVWAGVWAEEAEALSVAAF